MNWRYLILDDDGSAPLIARLNALGGAGWELVAVVPCSVMVAPGSVLQGHAYVFKKPEPEGTGS